MDTTIAVVSTPTTAPLTNPEKIKKGLDRSLRLFLFLFFGILLSFPLLATVSVHLKLNFESIKSQIGTVCRSRDCLAKSMQFFYFTDQNEDPCDNFYQYACGNFININPLLPDKTFYRKAKSLMSSRVKYSDPKYFNLIRTFYESCVDQGIIYSQLDYSPFKKIIKDIENSKWNKNETKKWTQLYEIFTNVGLYPDGLLSIDSVPVEFLTITNMITLITRPKKILTAIDPQKLLLYYLALYGTHSESENETLAADVQTLINFENKLIGNFVNIIQETGDKKILDVITEAKFLTKLSNYTNLSIDWKLLIDAMIPDYLNIEKSIVIIENSTYFVNLKKAVEETDGVTISKYLVIRQVISMADDFFVEKLSIRKKEEKCVGITLKYLPYPFFNMYQHYYFTKASQNLVLNEVDSLKRTFKNLLKNSSWLSYSDKYIYPSLLSDIRIVFGRFYNNENLTYFDDLELADCKYIENILKINKKKINLVTKQYSMQYRKLRQYDVHYLSNYVIEYVDRGNALIIAPSAIHHYYITDQMPTFVNYNQFGSIAAQRIAKAIHHFIQINLYLNGWVDESASNYYLSQQCYKTDKLNYYGDEYILNETRKAEIENYIDNDIANFGGVKAAYLAYEDFLKNNTDLLYLPDMGLSKKQLYWVLFAQMVCRKPIIDESISSIEYQINGPLKNFEQFAEDFNCPIDSRMNPVKKCNAIW